MTEREAVEKLKNMRLFMQIEDNKNECKFTEDDYKANEMAVQALEKQIPKKPIKSENQVVRYVNTYYCPTCELGITGTNIAKWCYHCGQAIDWSDVD